MQKNSLKAQSKPGTPTQIKTHTHSPEQQFRRTVPSCRDILSVVGVRPFGQVTSKAWVTKTRQMLHPTEYSSIHPESQRQDRCYTPHNIVARVLSQRQGGCYMLHNIVAGLVKSSSIFKWRKEWQKVSHQNRNPPLLSVHRRHGGCAWATSSTYYWASPPRGSDCTEAWGQTSWGPLLQKTITMKPQKCIKYYLWKEY